MQINHLLLHLKQNDSQRKMSGKSNWLANESNLSDQSYKCFIQMNKASLF